MNKKDFRILCVFNAVSLALLIEHRCGLELALPLLCVWTAISLVAHVMILKNYIGTAVAEE
jgi:hypothetical protein